MNKTQLDKTLGTIKNYVDGQRKIALVGSDTADTAGWYKVAEQTCSGHGDTNITFAVTSTYANYYSGILELQIRSDNTSISCRVLKWLTRIGFDVNHFIVVISGMKWTLYAYQPQSQYGRIAFEILSESSISSKNQSWTLTFKDNKTRETTAPKATVKSTDGATVASANKLSTARTISLTGDVTGSASFDGSANASIKATVADNSHSHNNYLPLAGGKMTGNIQLNSKHLYLQTSSDNPKIGVASTTDVTDADGNATNDVFIANANNNYLRLRANKTMTYAGYKVYTSGDKPTPADIGAATSGHNHDSAYLKLSGGTLSGKVSDSRITTGNTQLFNAAASQIYIGNPGTPLMIESSTNPTVNKAGTTYTLYHTGNKPSAADIGAAARSHTHDYITSKDTRAANEKPDDVQQGLSIHLKSTGADGLSDGGSYHPAIHIKPWNDHSGGPYGELALTQNQNLWFRTSSSGTAWNAWKKVSLDGHTHNYAASSHNHTSLTGVTRINFAADGSDSAYIGSTVSSGTTSLDFGISDDGGVDKFRWISSIWNSSSESTNTYTAMSLLPGTTSANLYVTGNVNAEKGGRCYAYNADNSKSVSIGVGGGDVFITNSKSGKYLQLKDDGTLAYSDDRIITNSILSGSIPKPSSGSWFKGFVNIAGDGVTEVGKYLDFHNTNTSTADYDVRLSVANGGLSCSGGLSSDGNITMNNSGNAVIVKITGGAAYEGLKGGGDGICVGDNGTKLYLRHKSQINIENSSYTRKLANLTGSGGVDIGDTSCRLSLHSNDNPIYWNGSSGYDLVTMSGMDIEHNKIRYGSGIGGANGYITFSY